MSQFLINSIRYGCRTVRFSPPTSNLGFVRDPNIHLLRWSSSSSNRQSFAVSYLENSLGFSSKAALSVSRYVNFQTPERPDEVVKFFKDRGFRKTQMLRLVRGCPQILTLNAEKNFLPKLEFLESKGISRPELAKMLSVFPNVLRVSLAKRIKPAYGFIWNLFKSDEKAIVAVKRFPDILIHDIDKFVAPNIAILRDNRVPDFNIEKMMQAWPNSLLATPYDFRKVVEKVVDMGFDATGLSQNFVTAVHVLRWISESRWENKVDAYKKWGFSEDEVLKTFKKFPRFMALSEGKFTACMEFFINQMGWRPCLIAKHPLVLTLSLRKRVIPRCSVFQVLLLKGLVEKEPSLCVLLGSSEKKFLQKFVTAYKEEAPELLKLYKEKLDLSDEAKID